MLKRSSAMLVTCVVMSLYIGVERLHAQAYCGLRDPVRNLYKIYPEADAYRSIVRSVDKRTRTQVSERLPFTLHFNELAKHTVYVAVKESQPVGLVHVRSEKGKWGLVEIAWALDLDLNIQGFHFQRCRDKRKTGLENQAFASQIMGKGLPALRLMLSEDALSLDTNRISVPKGCEALALTVLRSAMKTITVTDIVWSGDLKRLRAQAEAKSRQ